MKRVVVLLAAVAAIAAGSASATDPVPEYQLKAEFLVRFTLFIDWPEPAPNVSSEPFVIGIVGANPFGDYLRERTAGHLIKGRPVVVRTELSPDGAGSCDMVFIAGSARSQLDRVLARTAGRPVLTIGDTPGFGDRGVLINFFVEQDQVHFEINEAAVHRSGLTFGSKLYRLARLVGPEVR